MSIYFFIYVSVLIGILHIFFTTYKRYIRLLYGKFFLLSLFFFFLWFGLYLVAFSTTIDTDNLLILSRILYSLSLVAMYCMTGYFFFFGKTIYSTVQKRNIIYSTFFLISCTFFLAIGSKLVIDAMIYDSGLGFHYEHFGPWFKVFSFLYILNPLLTALIVFITIKHIQGINKLRYLYISLGYLVFIFAFVFILALLPLFSIWILQKEQVIFFIPFLLLFSYACYRYKFFELGVGIGKILNIVIPLILSISTVLLLKQYFSQGEDMVNFFWGNSYIFGITEMLLAISLFFLLRKLLKKGISSDIGDFSKNIEYSKQKIPHLMNITSLNQYLTIEISKKLGISELKIITFDDSSYTELQKYFSHSSGTDALPNDEVFLSEKRYKFDEERLKKELDKKVSLYIPLYTKSGLLLGSLLCGQKRFYDPYLYREIDALDSLARFLEGHLKYISIYSQIHELNINLDKKVDEKTIEYNNLINRQKEFIAFVSHEIKNPVTNALFLCDAIIEDLERYKKSGNTQERLTEDISILNSELIKIGELTKKIFSIEKYDLGKIKLFKEHTNVYDFLQEEIQMFEMKYAHIDFIINICNVGNCEIDRIQFRQVLHNLIENAVKFTRPQEPKVCITLLGKIEDQITFTIEDNGKGFEGIDLSSLFDKYSTGDSSSIGLGMGLYLCKRIVELHGWNIEAERSQSLGGAKFSIIVK